MGRFDFQSPGAAFTAQITDLLTQRKAEERQRLLDSLTMNADVRAQEAAQREQKESDARLAANQQAMELERIHALTANMNAGDDPESMGWSPENIELGKRWGAFKQMPQPSVSTSETFTDESGNPIGEGPSQVTPPEPTPPPKPKYGYVGTAQDRERQRHQTESGLVIKGLMDKPETRKVGEFLMQIAEANDGIVPPDLMAQFLAPDTPLYMFDEQSGKITQHGTVPSTGKIVTRSRPPASYYTGSSGVVGYTRDGFPVVQNHRTGKLEVDKTVGPMKQAGDEAGLGIPQGLTTEHYVRIAGMGDGSDPDGMRAYRASALGMIASAKVSPTVKSLATLMVNDFAKYAQTLPSVQLDDNEIAQLQQLVGAIAPPEVAEILKTHPAVPQNQKSGWFGGSK